jgi:hypothetical protein
MTLAVTQIVKFEEPQISSELVRDWQQSITGLATPNRVQMVLVHGHESINGNEIEG